jgi:hypothetical protein
MTLVTHADKTPVPDDPIPIAPLRTTTYRGWTNAYHLKNDLIEVVIAPRTGRLIHLGFLDSENLLRLDERSLEEAQPPDGWVNAGGDWVWPVAQPAWKQIQGRTWPPPDVFDNRPWSGRAWRSQDGSLNGLMTQDFGDPVHVRLSRTVRLDPKAPHLLIRQRLERLERSSIPVTLWQVTQLREADLLIMAVDGEPLPLLFDPPPASAMARCEGAIAYSPLHGTEHKLGSNSTRAWVAALRGHDLLIVRAVEGDNPGTYPDGGCALQIYGNTGLHYGEIETLSREFVIEPGQTIDNTLHLSLHRLETLPATPCALVEIVRTLIGEIEPVTPDT